MTPASAEIALDAGYRVSESVGILGGAGYGVLIPKLCATPGDCTSSLGSDVTLVIGARFFAPKIGPSQPWMDLGVGYEWFSSRLSDEGVVATRSYHGPTFLALRVGGDLRLSRHFFLAPVLASSMGAFSSSSLDASGIHRSGHVDGVAVHGWLALGVRLGYEP